MRVYEVQETKLISKSILLLTITPKRKRDTLIFYPGQYAAIGFKRYGRPSPMRCFSIISSPNNPRAVQFAMRIQGDFTTSVSQLNKGDTVFLHGPFGDFTIDPRYDKNIILLAGGIGVTPFISMARYAADTNLQIPMTLLYSCSYPNDIPFMEELVKLEERNPQFQVAFFITKGQVERVPHVRNLQGRIDKERLHQLTNGQYDRFTYFICGPKQFTKSLRNILLKSNVATERIITEEFTSTNSAAAMDTLPKYSIRRWTYGLAGAALILATFFFMAIDLVRFVPKSLHSQAAAITTPASQTAQANSPNTSTNTSSPTSQMYTAQTPTSSNSSSNNSSTNTVYTAAPMQTYQPPVTSVS